MTLTLTAEDRDVIQSIVDASITAAVGAPATSAQGLTRNGTVESYDDPSRTAKVLVDGDTEPADIVNALTIPLTAGQRVKVQFQNSGGAHIMGLASDPPAAPAAPPAALWRDVQYLLVESDLGVSSSTTYNVYGNNGSPSTAGYKIPVDGTVTVILVVQGRFTAAGEQQVTITAGTDLTAPAASYAWRAEGGADFGRVNLVGLFHAAVTKDQVILPDFAVVVDAGTPTFYLNGWEAIIEFGPTDFLLPAA